MGLSSSKAQPRVTRVAPVPTQGDVPALAALQGLPREPGQPTPWGKPIFHLELPPLRETWYGRASAGPLSWNSLPGKDGTSIIKQHPPRRPQRLEPAILPQAITPVKPWSQPEVAASPKPKVLEKRGQSLNPLPGRRQHLHKLQMLDLTRKRREAELKRNLHREVKINKQNIKEFSPKDVLDTPQRGDSTRSPDPIPAEHNQRFPEDHPGTTWGGGLSRQPGRAELSPDRRGKVDLWLCREPRTRDLFWDSSSTGSEEWEREEKIHHKPTLVRTKTERVSLFDDFFDRDF
ncbi:factor associated with metabolism and energy isoform X1 [Anomalospiza imberbis]|uniref:factor associated with metabolism and energy isoform X1 n=1 Tax=Anomalospiza imberbis TaxID=187417 RepID=UPI00358E14F5